mgnify:CR=1 FL=1
MSNLRPIPAGPPADEAAEREILRALLEIPTAPFREEAVVARIQRWAAERGRPARRDGAGNLWLEGPPPRPDRRRPAARWIYVAHMDHPGFVAIAQRGRRLTAQFRGSVDDAYFRGARARFFTPSGEVAAVVRALGPEPGRPFRRCALDLPSGARVPPGALGMWDFAGCRVRGETIYARGCDDMAGVTAALCALDRLARGGPPEHRVSVLLTRAEEVGFVGALWAARQGHTPADAFVLSIETSKAQSAAPLGGGAVIRVGDRVSVFDCELTAHLAAVAERLSARDPSLRYRRQLMPGGTCEATAFQVHERRAAAVCVPLGAYHNMGPRGRLAPERIQWSDFRALVALLAELPRDRAAPAETAIALRRRLDRLLRERRPFLRYG